MSELLATAFWLGGIALFAWMFFIRPTSVLSNKDLSYRIILFAGLVLVWSIVLFMIDGFFTVMAFDD